MELGRRLKMRRQGGFLVAAYRCGFCTVSREWFSFAEMFIHIAAHCVYRDRPEP
jgi:hypothetical protein